MANDPEKTRLLSLAKAKLKINKQQRLVADDGYIHIPDVPDLFYICELVIWLVDDIIPNNEHKIQKGNSHFDCTIESIGYERLKSIPQSWISTLGIHNIGKGNKQIQAEAYLPLTWEQLQEDELMGNELDRHSFSHHRFLKTVLDSAYRDRDSFVALLAEYLGGPIRSQDDMYADSLKVLRLLQNNLLNYEMEASFRIPDLYAKRDHGVLMSFTLSEVNRFENEEWGLLYTYRFSQQTSNNFLQIIKAFVSNLIERYEKLEMQQRKPSLPKVAPEKLDTMRKAKDKASLILEILDSEGEELNSDAEGTGYNIDMNSYAIMILLNVLSQIKVFNSTLKVWRLGLAYHILTGYSYNSFNRYYQRGELDRKKLGKLTGKTNSKAGKAAVLELKKILESKALPLLQTILEK